MRNIQRMNVLQQGLISGILLGIINISLGLISSSTHITIIGVLVLIIDIVTYLYIGLRASQVTGRTGTGALVGLFTGLFSAIVSTIGTMIMSFTNIDALRQAAQNTADKLHQNIHITNNTVILGLLLGAIGGLILALVLGTIVGAIGGALGKSRARNNTVPEYSELSSR